jgi:leader peptidase (prepilin peptidase) / N-methyltransferase
LSAAVGAGVGFLTVQLLFVWAYELLTGRRGMGEGDAKLLLMIGAFLGWEAVLFSLVAGSLQGLVAAGLATAFGVPLVPSIPEHEENVGQSPESAQPAGEERAGGVDDARELEETSSAPMMVFGPMLALSALEFLFFGDVIVTWVAFRLGG